jgi:hypothetical protein
MQTAIFMVSAARRRGALQQQRDVGAAEAERVGQRVAHRQLALCLRHVVEVAVRVGTVEVDGRRRHLVMERQRRDAGLEAAAAPSRCPVIDLVDEMARRRAWSPNVVLIAIVSRRSLNGVEVPWALM